LESSPTKKHSSSFLSDESSLPILQSWISHSDASFHRFDPEEAAEIRHALLTWYYEHRRKLPWRGDAPPYDGSTAGINSNNNNNSNSTDNTNTINRSKKQKAKTVLKNENNHSHAQIEQSAYGTWVSEIMLQQTRVEAVIP
jgi:A/G-specific adenine glycosylase